MSLHPSLLIRVRNQYNLKRHILDFPHEFGLQLFRALGKLGMKHGERTETLENSVVEDRKVGERLAVSGAFLHGSYLNELVMLGGIETNLVNAKNLVHILANREQESVSLGYLLSVLRFRGRKRPLVLGQPRLQLGEPGFIVCGIRFGRFEALRDKRT
jgi:hypothetical protein